MDREVPGYLRKYAAEDKTVIVITHSTEHLWLADRVPVVASGGRPVYFGPADGVLQKLGATTYAELMRKLISDPGPAATSYQNGPAVTEAVEEAECMAQMTPYRGGSPAARRDPLTGQALTYSDIVNDYPIVRREHRTGTLTLPVITAKWCARRHRGTSAMRPSCACGSSRGRRSGRDH